jgi:hypothetical protein
MVAPGVNVKAHSTFLGDADLCITFDQDGYLLAGAEDEAPGVPDAYLAGGAGNDMASAREAERMLA